MNTEVCAVYECLVELPSQDGIAWILFISCLVLMGVLLFLNSRSTGPVIVDSGVSNVMKVAPTDKDIYWLNVLFVDETCFEVLAQGRFDWSLVNNKLTCTFDKVGIVVVVNAADYAVICQADSSKEPVFLSYDNVASAELSHIHYTKNP